MNIDVDALIASIQNFDWTSPTAYYIYAGIALVYIIAQIFSRATECVILWKWYDLICILLTIVSPLVMYVWLLFCQAVDMSSKVSIGGCYVCLFGPMSVSYIFSIVANWGHGLVSIVYILVSLLGKTVLLIFSPIVFLAFLMVKHSGDSAHADARFSDGTRGNRKTAIIGKALAIFLLIFTPLIFDLVKPYTLSENIKDTLKSIVGL